MTLFWLSAGATQALWLLSLRFLPWNRHAPAFIAVFMGAFLIYLLFWRRLERFPRAVPWLWLILTGLLFRATVFLAPPCLSDDIYRYLWDGRVQMAGINPYERAPEDPALAPLRDDYFSGINHKSVKTIYPPLAQLCFRLAAAVSPTPTAQRILFGASDAAVIVLLIFYLRLKKRPEQNVFLYAWNPLVLVEFSSSGHLDSLGILLLMAGLFLYEKRRPAAAGAAWGAGALAKLAPVMLIPWMARRGPGRKALFPFFLAIAAGYAFFLWPPLLETRSLFAGGAAYVRDWSFNAGLWSFFQLVTPLSGGAAKAVLFAAAAGAALWLAASLQEEDVLAYAGILWTLILLASPVVYPWYVAWLAPFLCFYPFWPGLLFTGLSALSYLVLRQYALTGLWTLPAWVPWLEYGIPLSLLLAQARRPRGLSPRPPSPAGRVRPAIVIPAYNEEAALPAVLSEIPRDHSPWIIVVDNGSTDGTARAAQEGGAILVSEPRKGYGRAVSTGLSHVPEEANVVVVMDADHSDYPEDLLLLLEPLEKGLADFVIGSRVMGGAPAGSLTPQQRFGNWLSCLLIEVLYGRRFTDLGPFRAIRKDALISFGMEDGNFGWNVEMQVKALEGGFRVAEVPVRYRRRIGVSKISGTLKGSFMAGVKILYTIFKYGLLGTSRKGERYVQ